MLCAQTISLMQPGGMKPLHTSNMCILCSQVDRQGSWLLDGGRSKRIVVHMRRGDVTSLTTKRALPTSFYLNVVKQVIQVCRLKAQLRTRSCSCCSSYITPSFLVYLLRHYSLYIIPQKNSCSEH
jgi:hypothetical protein